MILDHFEENFEAFAIDEVVKGMIVSSNDARYCEHNST